MGGCRCTYRNCTVRSDGKTHMFHYPVFEKVRCRQWLINAQRLDFLNLKVSQLKNRVVCQHHFKDECFMNYKKDKLIVGAVPTENGPYCDLSMLPKESESNNIYSIILEDIENDCISFSDKKANFPVKYADFLTNCEDFVFPTINLKTENENADVVSLVPDNMKNPNLTSKCKAKTPPFLLNNTNNNQNQIHPTLLVPPFSASIDENKLTCEIEIDIQNESHKQNNNLKHVERVAEVQKEPKIKIISENKIEGPIQIKGKLTKLSPSNTLKLPHVLNTDEGHSKITITELLQEPAHSENAPSLIPQFKTFANTFEVAVKHDKQRSLPMTEPFEESPKKEPIEPNSKNVLSKTKNSTPKSKITPERLAAIKNKRQFNMKLRNIIEDVLEQKINLDNKRNSGSSEKPFPKPFSKNEFQTPEMRVQNKPSHTNLQHNQSSLQQCTIAFLEERLNKMEHILLKRIDQNSQQISELKNSVCKRSQGKRDIYVQTNESEISYKKFLYQEISHYLSPGTNSTIYEELFINKFFAPESKYTQRYKRKKLSQC